MLEKTDGLLLDQLADHVTKHRSNSVETLVSLADVGEASIVKEDFLDDEDGNGLAEFGAGFHDAEAQWDNFGCKKKVDNLGRIIFHQCSDDAEGRETKILKWARFRGGIEKWIEKKGNMSCTC
jgi:hypothetical protein